MAAPPSLRQVISLLVVVILFPLVPAAVAQPAEAPLGDSEDAQSRLSVGKPLGNGTYQVGYTYDNITTSTKNYSMKLKIFYPAVQAGENATGDMTGGPYPTVVWLPGACCGPEHYKDILAVMATWGIIVMTVGLNWDDYQHSGNVSDLEDFLDYLEARNVTSGSHIFGMVDKEAFGLTGHSAGGGISLVDAAFVDRIKATHVLAPAVSNSTVDAVSSYWHRPFMCQVSQNDDYYINGCRHAFDRLPVLNSKIELLGGDHLGPYHEELMIAFFLLHLDGVTDYWKYLYGNDAVTDSIPSNYDVSFRVPNVTFFPPELKIISIQTCRDDPSLYMDVPICAVGTIDGMYLPDYPKSGFSWDFNNDGLVDFQNATEFNATYIYTEPGNYSPILKYSLGRYAFTPSELMHIEIHNREPLVRVEYDDTVMEDEVVFFNASKSNDTSSDVDTLQFKWDFGDGTILDFAYRDIGSEVTHSYKKTGWYWGSIIIKDRHGACSNRDITVLVKNSNPVVDGGVDRTVVEDDPIVLSAVGIDSKTDMETLLYQWDFGDGSGTSYSINPSANHTYTQNGTYIAKVTVADNDDAYGTDLVNITVVDTSPILEIISPGPLSKFDEDDPVQFIGKAWDTPTDYEGLEYQWDFGDGSGSELSLDPSATHIYNDIGTFTVRFMVWDEDNINSTTVDITVVNVGPSIVMTSPANVQFVVEDDVVTFKGVPTDTQSDEEQLISNWYIDGMTYNGTEATHKFTKAGTYEARFRVKDAHGAIMDRSIAITVFNTPPIIDAIVAPVTLIAGEKVTCSATVEDTPSDLDTLRILWDFGDGTNSTNLKGSHIYSEPGSYVLIVTVTDNNNETDSLSYAITVMKPSVPPPPPEEEEGMDPLALEVGLLALMIAAVALMASAFITKETPRVVPSGRRKGKRMNKASHKGRNAKKQKT